MALFTPKNRLAIRVYGQGFGDCILIAIKPDANDPQVDYLVIDCGIYMGTSGRNARLREVIADVIASTGGDLRVLAITHEHFDHVAGWYQTADEWNGVNSIRELWQAWTERPGDPFAQSVKDTINYKFKLALGLRSPSALKAMDDAEASVFGLNVEFSKATAASLKRAVEFAESKGARRCYWDPGKVEKWSDDVQFIFMGPPKNIGLIYQDVWKSGEPRLRADSEGVPLNAAGQRDLMALDNLAIERRLADLGVDSREDEELARIRIALGLASKSEPPPPFDRRFALDRGDKRWTDLEPVSSCAGANHHEEPKLPQDRYDADPRRQIDGKGAGDLGRLALQMDNLTNNTSLVFALRLGDDCYLFVGDAQVGNWYGFFLQDYDLGGGTKMTAQDILGKTRFYKVGHHGSHNATIFAKGLDLMPDGLVSIVPTEPDRYNGVPDVGADGVIAKLTTKGPSMRTDLAETRDVFQAGPVSPVTNRPLYVEYHA